jgi:hypothetical protein
VWDRMRYPSYLEGEHSLHCFYCLLLSNSIKEINSKNTTSMASFLASEA